MAVKIIRKTEVLERTGLSNASIYRLINKGMFPRQKRLTGAGGRAVGWLESDIDNWIISRGEVE